MYKPMKKLLIIALAVFATTAFAVNPGVKKDKKKKKAVAAAVIQPAYPQLLSASDSLSYAAGMFTTRGLMDYVKTQFGIDSTNVQTFIETLREAVSAQHDKQFAARCAAMQIAQMIDTRIYPNVSSDVKGTEYTLDSIKFNSGFLAAVASDTTLMHQDFAERYFQTTMKEAKERAERQYKLDNEAWIKQNATKEGVKTTTSGLQYKVLTAGKGSIATKDDNVTVKYEGYHNVPPRPGHQGLDRGTLHDARGQQVGTLYSAEPWLRSTLGWRNQALLNTHLHR